MKAYRRDGTIFIEIDEQQFLEGLPEHPVHEGRIILHDREKFLKYVSSQITTHGDDGDRESCSKLTRLLDSITTAAIEADAGVGLDI